MARVLTGIQPFGRLHIGAYLGVLRGLVDEQEQQDVWILIADLHAVAEGCDAAALSAATIDKAAELLAAGADPGLCTIFVQSHVPEHVELCWLLSAVATVAELGPMSDAEAAGDRGLSAAQLEAPVLQSADILLYQADYVPAGAEQSGRIALARRLAERFNRRYGPTFRLPQAVPPAVASRIADLQRPSERMSKSGGLERGRINIADAPDEIARKIRRAVTHPDREVVPGRMGAGGMNLLTILAAIERTSVEDAVERFAGAGFGAVKERLAEALVEELRPMRERLADLTDSRDELERQLAAGAARARTVATGSLASASGGVGLLAPFPPPLIEPPTASVDAVRA